MPKVYLRHTVVDAGYPAIFEVVDGQQRLAAIFSYIDNEFELKQKHNHDFGNARFGELPDPVRRGFLNYAVSVEVMEDASDSEVWGMFERLNRYTSTLNAQERRNAEFTGTFKLMSYKLADEQESLETWKAMGVFKDQQFARMREVEMTSDVLVAIIDGITDIARLNAVYKKYDDEVPSEREVVAVFRSTLRFVREHLADSVRATKFKLQARTYSLLVAVADAMTGIPHGLGPVTTQPPEVIRERMIILNGALQPVEVSPGLVKLKGALTRATSHAPERLVRNAHLVPMLTLSGQEWKERWDQLMNPPASGR